MLSTVDKFILDKVAEKNVERSTINTIKTHQKEIRNLTKNIALPFTHNETIHNLSTITLTTGELDVLKYGLKHPIHPLHVNKTDVLTTFDFILRTMTKDLKNEKQLKAKISNLANTYVNNYRPSKYAMKKREILKRLRKNNNIVILRPDKGDGTGIMDRNVYIQKIFEIIKDRTKFKELSTDPTIIREGQLQRFLRSMKNKNIFTKETCEIIYPSGSKTAFIYGTPEIHKLKHKNISDLSLRSIISSIGTYNYNQAKFLSSLLEPVISTTHCTKDLFSFCQEIKKVRDSNKFLVSYDVCSLYTSIPLAETIDIAVDLLFEKNPGFKISKADLRKLFQFATSGVHFMFQGKFYDQVDSVAMGSPLGPVLANLFMGYHAQKWLQSFEECELVLYRRYVDDIICLFNSESDADKFFVFLNQRHPKIKFTIEKQTENQLSFLDLLITSNGNNFQTSDYWKKHSIGLYTNYLIFTRFSYKMGLIKKLLHRAFVISSNWSIFHVELSKTKELLEKIFIQVISLINRSSNTCMHNLVIKSTKNLVILHMSHIINYLILVICRQKSNKK